MLELCWVLELLVCVVCVHVLFGIVWCVLKPGIGVVIWSSVWCVWCVVRFEGGWGTGNGVVV